MPRKLKLEKEKYLEAVKRIKNTNDTKIGKILGIDRSTVFRFRKSHPEILDESNKILEEINNIHFDSKYISYDVYEKIPSITEWKNTLIKREVSKTQIKVYLRGLFYLCTYLKVHPDDLNIDLVSDTLINLKLKQNLGEALPRGMSFFTQRKSIRSFFTVQKGISGEILSSKGVDAKQSKNSGSLARQRVSEAQRKIFEEALNDVVKEFFPKKSCEDLENIYIEALQIAKFMYYTGTRKTASCIVRLDTTDNHYMKNEWILQVTDKGKNGGIKWEKILIGFALEEFKQYICKRFKIDYDELETEAREITFAFPFFRKRSYLITDIYGIALKRSGNNARIPAHIWRHTFAQDFLSASDGNYELCASLGGWVSTHVLKKHYGEMGVSSKIRGLKKAMGLPVENVTSELKW